MSHDDLSDEAVARAMKQEAQVRSAKYSTMGLQAFLPTRATSAAPKPNTRFLRNILRETDSHNAALLAKEQRETRDRLKLNHQRKERSLPLETHRRRREASDTDHGPNAKRRRVSDHPRRDRSRSPRRERGERSPKIDALESSRHRQGRLSRYSEESSLDEQFSSSRVRKYEKGGRRSERSAQDEDYSDHSRRRTHRKRRASQSPQSRHRSSRYHHKSLSHSQENRNQHSHSPPVSCSHPRSRAMSNDPEPITIRQSPQSEASSDPLDSIIGPQPFKKADSIRSRGRGAFASSSAAMDERFSSAYDPSADVHPNSDEDDWDQALEALRDRQKWKALGAERLKSAGFSVEAIKKWEKGGEKDESDVKWTKRGEGREWDRGKIIAEDGSVDLKPEWGRLKGT